MTERWLPIAGYEGFYEVSDEGRVRTVERRVPNGGGTRHVGARIRRPTKTANGAALVVGLSKGDRQRVRTVHSLVLEAFIGPRPSGMEACHGDGDATNNRLENLRWDTHLENIRDKFRHGTDHNLAKTHCQRGHALVEPNLKPAQLAKGGRSCLSCSREYGLARTQGRPFSLERADDRYRALGF